MICNDCGEEFKNLAKHYNRPNTICKIHKDILFTCRLCGYICKNYKFIISHTKLCIGELKLNSPIELLESKLKFTEDKLKTSEKLIEKYTKHISELDRTIQIEKIYNNALNIILNKYSGIPSSEYRDLREDLTDGIHIHKLQEEDIPLLFHINTRDRVLQSKGETSTLGRSQSKVPAIVSEDTSKGGVAYGDSEESGIIQINLGKNSDKNKWENKNFKPKKDRYRPVPKVEILKDLHEIIEIREHSGVIHEPLDEVNPSGLSYENTCLIDSTIGIQSELLLSESSEIKPRVRESIKKIKSPVTREYLVSNKVISDIDENIKEIMNLNFENINLEECHLTIKNIFNSVKEGKLYGKDLNLISKIRYKMLGWLNIKEYENVINEHLNTLNNIFIDKKYDKNKRNKLIFDSFTSLELRLIRFGKYFEKVLDIDDVERLRISMEICTDFPKKYEPFKRSFKKLQNYNIVLFTLKKCIESNLINKYGFNNIVYIKLPNSKHNDPYSFYYLEKVVGEDILTSKRYWKLDCRLEDISEELSNNLLPYCITLYRNIYFDMFGDNIYRNDIDTIYPIAGNEMDQLVENILILSNLEKCRDLLIEIINVNCVHKPTDIDFINLRADDSSQKSRFKDYRKNFNYNEIIHKLFNIISDNEIDYFLNKFKF
jgi:hypothetical protein